MLQCEPLSVIVGIQQVARQAAVSARWRSSREAAGRSRHQSVSRDMGRWVCVSRADRSGNQAVGWLLEGPSCVSLCPVLGRFVRGSGPDRRGSLVETREREIWCRWHAVVFVRVKGNGAIEMGPRWSKDSRRLWSGNPGRGWPSMDGPKIEGGQMPARAPVMVKTPPVGLDAWVGVVGRGSSGNLWRRAQTAPGVSCRAVEASP